jgi:hypothetical protein
VQYRALLGGGCRHGGDRGSRQRPEKSGRLKSIFCKMMPHAHPWGVTCEC